MTEKVFSKSEIRRFNRGNISEDEEVNKGTKKTGKHSHLARSPKLKTSYGDS